MNRSIGIENTCHTDMEVYLRLVQTLKFTFTMHSIDFQRKN